MSVIGEAFVRISPESAEFAEKTKSQLTSALGGVGPALGAAAVVGVVAALGEIGEKFAEVRHQIQQETGATGAELEGLFGTVKTVLKDVPASFGDVTAAVDELSRRGVPLGAQLDKLAEQELFLAKITKTDLATNTEQTTAIFAKFNVPIKEQSRELDVLFKATQKSGKGLGDLTGPLLAGGAALGEFGFSLDESIGLVTGLERAGINVGPVLASLKKAFANIAKEGGDPKKALHDVFQELESGKDPTKAMADALKLFGARGGLELARAVKQGKLSVHELIKEITDGKDGIIATGKETESLGDKIKLFRNQALVDIEPVGTAILNTFEKGVEEAAPVLDHLGTSVANFVKAIVPAVAPVGIALVGTFKLALPVIDTLATGLDTITSALGHVPAPVLAVAGALGIGALAFHEIGGAELVAVAGLEAFEAAVAFATGPIGITLGIIGAIGLATRLFSHDASAASKEAKDLGQALFDSGGDGKVFADGVSDAATGFAKFLNEQIKAGKDKTLDDALTRSGQSVDALIGHLNDGDAAWSKFAQGVAEAAGKSKVHISDLDRQIAAQEPGIGLTGPLTKRAEAVAKYTAELQKQRDAFDETARTELRFVASSGELDQKQIDQIVRTHKLTDGTVDYGAVLTDVQRKIEDASAAQNASAESAVQTKQAYSDLVDQLAAGEITAADAGAALQGFGFDADGAKTKVSDLQSQIKSFLSAVQAGLPGTADAAKSFSQQLQKDTEQFTSDVQKHAELLKQSATAGSQASTSLKDSIVQNNADIKKDYSALVADSDPAKFVAQIQKQAADAASFFANIKKLVAEGFGSLAGQLIQLGPQVGGALASGLVSDKTKADQANAAATLLDNQNAALLQFSKTHFSELNGIGEDIGKTVTDGVAKGVGKGTEHVAESVRLATGRAAFPDEGTVQKYADFGAALGGHLVDGIVTGISGNTFKIQGATKEQADIVRAALDKNYAVQSPSKMTQRVGRFLSDGLALGIADNTRAVVAQVAKTAAATEAAFKGLEAIKVKVAPVVQPTTPQRFLGALQPKVQQPVKAPPLTKDQIAAIKFIGSDDVQRLLAGFAKLKPKVDAPADFLAALKPKPAPAPKAEPPTTDFLRALRPKDPPTAHEIAAALPKPPPPPKVEISTDFLKALRPAPAPVLTPPLEFLKKLNPKAPTPALTRDQLAALQFIGADATQKILLALGKLQPGTAPVVKAVAVPTAVTSSSKSSTVGSGSESDPLIVAMRILDTDVGALAHAVGRLAAEVAASAPLAHRPITIDARGHANPKLIASEIAWQIS